MTVTYDDAKALLETLKIRDERRHFELKALRRYWEGDYWGSGNNNDRTTVTSVVQLFRDLKGAQTEVGPDLKLVHNLLQEVCVKYQTFLSPVPMARTFVDPPSSDLKREQATKKLRVIYGTWGANRMSSVMADIGWYLPLMGDCFVGIWPDFDRKIPRMLLRSPEYAHPVHSWDGRTLDQIIFRRDETERTISRNFPNFRPQADRPRFLNGFRPKPDPQGEKRVELLEYSDESSYSLWAGDQLLKQINHDFGFNLFGQMAFIPVPGKPFNHGAVEQIVSLVEMGNALHSLMFQATLENVFPMMVIENPAAAPEEIMRGAGAVVPVNAGGKVYYETPPVQALPVQLAFLQDNADKVLEASGMPRVNFGQSPTTSIATGSAINELQGAGTGSTVEMVQGASIGPELVAWNEKAFEVYRQLFRDDTIGLQGTERKTIADLNAREFAITFKGREIIGSTRNEVVFSPHLDDREKLVMSLQALGGGLVSKKYGREQIGITDNDAMVEEILSEQLEDGVLQAIVQKLAQDPTPQNEQQAMAQVLQVVDGTPLPTVVEPHPGLAVGAGAGPTPAGAPPGAPPAGGPAGGGSPFGPLPGGGQVQSPALPLPPGSPLPGSSPGGPPPGPPAGAPGGQTATNTVTVQDALTAFQPVKLNGRAWLVGEIVAKGRTANVVEIAVTDKTDEAALKSAAPFPTLFHLVAAQPEEDAVEINGQAQQQAA